MREAMTVGCKRLDGRCASRISAPEMKMEPVGYQPTSKRPTNERVFTVTFDFTR